MKNIVLTGMPGAGKSTIGVLLAKTLGMPFLDTDLLIQEREKSLLQEILLIRGVEGFLKVEEKIVLSVSCTCTVLATGGSAVCSEASMWHLKKYGFVVYLKLPYVEIEQRVKNIASRGIALHKNQSLQDIYNQRISLYEEYADIVFDCTGRDIESTVEALTTILRPQISVE